MADYETSEEYIRRMSMLSSRELARYLDEASNENRRLKSWVENAKYVIGILAAIVLFLSVAYFSGPVGIGGPMVSDDYHGQPIGPFQ